MTARGKLFVVAGPSGAGKHTVLERVLANDDRLGYSISATTRAPRPGEVNGKEYFFLERDIFERRIEAGEFLEWAEVHGNLYGTLHTEVNRLLDSGLDLLLEVDVQGARALVNGENDPVTVFVAPPSLDELAARLRKRGANSEDDMRLRLRNAETEMAAAPEFDYVVVNDDLDEAVADVEAILRAERQGTSQNT